MNRRRTLNWLLLLASGFAARGLGAQPVPAKDRTVLLISLDGFPAWKLDDPRLPIPNLRALAKQGSTAAGMRVCNPTFTWPSHTTMATGDWPWKHGVLHNGLLVREGDGAPVREDAKLSGARMIQVPTIYDVAHKAGLTTAEVVWPLAKDSRSIDWGFNELPQADGRIEQEMMRDGKLQLVDLDRFMKSSPVWRDEIWSDAASYILARYQPNLMLVHLLNEDAMNHRFGPEGWPSDTACAYIDACVRKILNAAPKGRQLTVVVVSDHGFETVKRTIRPNVVLKEHGLLKVHDGKVRCDAYAVPEGGTAMVYLTSPKADRVRLLAKLREIFLATEGVEGIILPPEYHKLGMPTPEENPQMADLVVTSKPGYAFWPPDTDGPPVADVTDKELRGHHAYLNDNPKMNSIFIAAGYGIRKGIRLPVVDSVDVAPTVAALLGLRMKEVDGKPLERVLEESSQAMR